MKINVQEFFNQHKLSSFQWMIFVFTFLVAFFDGLDTAAIGYIAPSLLAEWGMEKKELAPVMSAALFGLAFGAVAFGPLADKVGRKLMLVVSVFIFSAFSIASAFATNLTQLEILRFITGVGLGAAMPNAVTILSEFCPEKKRSFLVNTMYCGFPLGAAAGGFVSAWLIPNFGWQSVLIVGGSIPLIMSIIMLFMIPESVNYMVLNKHPLDKIKRTLAKIDPSANQATEFVLTEKAPVTTNQQSGMSVVLSKHYIVGSVMLWASYFLGLMVFYAIINWMPTLIAEAKGAGMDPKLGPVISGLFALGGLGAIANGWLMDRFNGNLLIALFSILTAVFVGIIGVSLSWGVSAFIAVVILAGIFQNTAQSSLPSLAANFYPTAGRTTGVSWMTGIGRFGAIAGSFLMAEMVAREMTLENMFYVLAIPSVIMMVCLLVKNAVYPEKKSASNANQVVGH
ncbi:MULTISPECIES: MFS transporter [Vitreoscilla]|uniref:MFS transporter n=1 Tax=Vitreoscilla stercoraria TaxID=61 RepID=A0ABY4EIJ2_VITST|nr:MULTISPECIES: MFS transporter [Vitreoscilla]UOO93192.1 MFS transporter [Vitreoscilla stercoraria]